MLNKEIQIPIRIMRDKKTKKPRIILSRSFSKVAFFAVLAFSLIIGQSYMLSAYEAHVINVTAKICRYSETRTIGFWKNHPEVYEQYLPQTLGEDPIETQEAADVIFQNANADDMVDMLWAQLLAMKFNIEHFDVGEYFVEGWGTVNYIVWLADQALIPPRPEREVMEEIKDALNYVNNLHRLSHCLEINPETQAPVFVIQGAPEPENNALKNDDFSGEPLITGTMIEPLEEPSELVCGNEILEGEEECDDGNIEDGDGCSATCTIELPLEPEPEPELPPEGGTPSDDGAEPEPEPVCGDGVVNQETEQCDDGSEGSETCSIECTIIEPLLEEPPLEEPPVEEEPTPVCGDGVVNQETEQCDAGLEGSETCSIECTIIEILEPICGDGVQEESEECDDGNTEDGDGCSAICEIELPLEPVCGNEVKEETEECDGEDGVSEHYTCTEECSLEYVPYCGDGNLDEGEECDDGNLEDNDGCDSVCILEETL